MLSNNYYKVYDNTVDYFIVFINWNCLINTFKSCLVHVIGLFYVTSDINACLYNSHIQAIV